jgi:hypothetical protein
MPPKASTSVIIDRLMPDPDHAITVVFAIDFFSKSRHTCQQGIERFTVVTLHVHEDQLAE